MPKVIGRSMDILFTLAEVETGLSISQLATAVDYPLSTVYRLLRELEQRGLVRRSGEGTYGLGPALISLSRVALKQIAAELPSISLPFMQLLTQSTGETTILAVPSDLGAICVEIVLSPKPLHYGFEKGRILPYHAGATAVALLAYLDDMTVKRVIEANKESYYADGGQVSPDALESVIKRCRSEGYIVTRGEVDQGATGVGVPIFGQHGKLLAALTLAGPTDRFDVETLPTLINQVKQCAKDIQEKLSLIGF